MDVCSDLKCWGLPGPSSASFSSSLRWRSQSAAADQPYDWTGRVMKILFRPTQNPWQETHVDLNFLYSKYTVQAPIWLMKFISIYQKCIFLKCLHLWKRSLRALKLLSSKYKLPSHLISCDLATKKGYALIHFMWYVHKIKCKYSNATFNSQSIPGNVTNTCVFRYAHQESRGDTNNRDSSHHENKQIHKINLEEYMGGKCCHQVFQRRRWHKALSKNGLTSSE